MYVLECTNRETIVYMQFFDRFKSPAICSDLPESEKKLDILLSRVETPDSKNYWLMAATYSSWEFAESEAVRISNTLKERNPEKYPNGITFRVMELWRVMDSEKIRNQLKIHASENSSRIHHPRDL